MKKQPDIFAKCGARAAAEATAAHGPKTRNALPKGELKPPELSAPRASPLHDLPQKAREGCKLEELCKGHKSGNGERLKKLESLMDGAEKTAE
eukprot:5779817-Pyramimonas_sp.AAC.1